MRTVRNILALPALAAALLLAGCATVPFPEPAPFARPAGGLEAVPLQFAARIAPRFELLNAVVFRFWGRELTTLGMASVEPGRRSFVVSCMTPIGVKLFDAVCEQGHVEGRFVHPEIAKRGGDLAQAAGVDLGRAYFDWQPSGSATFAVKRGRLVFTDKDASGATEYRYAGSGQLAEKIRFEGGKPLWSVAYRQFSASEAGLVPTGLVIENHRYGYRLVVTAREREEKR